MNGVFEYLNMITVNQHSSVRLSASGKVLYVDPFELPAAPNTQNAGSFPWKLM